jgi:hypothetical protein
VQRQKSHAGGIRYPRLTLFQPGLRSTPEFAILRPPLVLCRADHRRRSRSSRSVRPVSDHTPATSGAAHRWRLAAAGFRVLPDEEGSIEEVVDLLLDYRPRLIALCSRLDVPTVRTLAEVKEPARDESSKRERPPYHLARSTARDGTYRKPYDAQNFSAHSRPN